MARYRTTDAHTPLWATAHADHALVHLRSDTEVGSIGDPVAGPAGHGSILHVYVPMLDMSGWVFVSLLRREGMATVAGQAVRAPE